MKLKPETTPEFDTALLSVPANVRVNMRNKADKTLTDWPYPPLKSIKKLTGNLVPFWRFRSGGFRMIFHPQPEKAKVVYHDIGPRGKIYGGKNYDTQ